MTLPGCGNLVAHAVIFARSERVAAVFSVVSGETEYEAPTDQVVLHRIVEAIYKSADEGREIRL